MPKADGKTSADSFTSSRAQRSDPGAHKSDNKAFCSWIAAAPMAPRDDGRGERLFRGFEDSVFFLASLAEALFDIVLHHRHKILRERGAAQRRRLLAVD